MTSRTQSFLYLYGPAIACGVSIAALAIGCFVAGRYLRKP